MSTLGVGGGGAHLHHPQSVSLYLVEVGEGLICIDHSVSLFTLGVGGGGAHLHHPQSVSLYLVEVGEGFNFIVSESPSTLWRRGTFASSTECLPLPRWEIGGLICTISVPSSTLGGGELEAHLHC